MKLYNHKKLSVIALSVYWGLLFIATTLPGKEIDKLNVQLNDKIEHFGGFSVLAVLLFYYIVNQTKSIILKKNPYLSVLIITIVYAIFDELHQLYIPNRSCEFLDFIADTIGVILGLTFVFLLQKFVLSKMGRVAGK